MTHIHLAVKDGKAVGTRLRDLSQNDFYMKEGKMYRLLVPGKYRNEGSVIGLSMTTLEVEYHDVKDVVHPIKLTNIRIEVDAE